MQMTRISEWLAAFPEEVAREGPAETTISKDEATPHSETVTELRLWQARWRHRVCCQGGSLLPNNQHFSFE